MMIPITMTQSILSTVPNANDSNIVQHRSIQNEELNNAHKKTVINHSFDQP
jgi:hypothetical protein